MQGVTPTALLNVIHYIKKLSSQHYWLPLLHSHKNCFEHSDFVPVITIILCITTYSVVSSWYLSLMSTFAIKMHCPTCVPTVVSGTSRDSTMWGYRWECNWDLLNLCPTEHHRMDGIVLVILLHNQSVPSYCTTWNGWNPTCDIFVTGMVLVIPLYNT